jgi:DNA-binding NarL/FixJ family response regulator
MNAPTRILLVDDHAMLRLGLREALMAEADLSVVAEASNGQQAFALYQEHLPDVVVMDNLMPGELGTAVTARLCADFPQARVLLFTVNEGEEDVARAVRAGAKGFLYKTAERNTIIDAVRVLAAGQTWFPAEIQAKLENHQRQLPLTDRELDVLRLIVAGRSNKEIVATLHVSEATVKLRIQHILVKLQVEDRTQAAIEAVRRGVVHLAN